MYYSASASLYCCVPAKIVLKPVMWQPLTNFYFLIFFFLLLFDNKISFLARLLQAPPRFDISLLSLTIYLFMAQFMLKKLHKILPKTILVTLMRDFNMKEVINWRMFLTVKVLYYQMRRKFYLVAQPLSQLKMLLI